MNIEQFKKLPVVGIARGIQEDAVEALIDAAASAGLEALEITMNTVGAPVLIRKAQACAQGRLAIGAGTVLTVDVMKTALDAGATFIVIPTFVKEVVEECVKRKVPVFPGALTPHEIYDAWSAGATMVKVFPAGVFGPKYFREIKGPFEKIELMAVGGVDTDNIKQFFEQGASAVAFGASVFRSEWLADGDFASISWAVKQHVQLVKSVLKELRIESV